MEAQKRCNADPESRDGHLVEINDQPENDFVSELILMSNPLPNVWSGGVVTTVAGLYFGIWHQSQNSIAFNKYYRKLQDTTNAG